MTQSTSSMGQRYAKHQMQEGVRLYHARRHHRAISKWRRVLRRLASSQDRFVTIGYIVQAYCDATDYNLMLYYALQQMELANSLNDNYMKSEAFLNLSKAYEHLADYSKTVSYGRASLQHASIDTTTHGYAHYEIAMAELNFGQFQSSLNAFEKAMNIANESGDKILELQICVGLGSLFTLLRDLSKALIFLRNALTILQLVTVDNVHAKYKSLILYHLSVVLRLKGAVGDAREACEEALKLSQQNSGKTIYARCLCSLADIYRELGESETRETITKSWARYEQAFRIMREVRDRMGEVIVLGSMAKSASESRSHYTGQCECQAIQLNKKCLEIATVIGCKYAMLKCHRRLQDLYLQLNDEDSEEIARKTATSLVQEMELFCNFCGQRYASVDESLQALRCSHIFHEKCLHDFLHERDSPTCPKCQCKAILMENISQGTSSASSTNENEINGGSTACSPSKKFPPVATKFTNRQSVSNHLPKVTITMDSSTATIQPAISFRPAIVIRSPSHDNSETIASTNTAPITNDPVQTRATSSIYQILEESWTFVSPDTSKDHEPSAIVTREATAQLKPLSRLQKPCCMTDSFPPLPEEILVGMGASLEDESDNTSRSQSVNTVRAISPGITDV